MQFSPPGGNGTKRVSSDEFPGVAQSVGRQLWELEAARSNRATRTKNAAPTAEKPQGLILCGFLFKA